MNRIAIVLAIAALAVVLDPVHAQNPNTPVPMQSAWSGRPDASDVQHLAEQPERLQQLRRPVDAMRQAGP